MDTLKKIWYRFRGYNDQDIYMITKLSEIEDMVKNMKCYLGKSEPDIHLPTPREKIEWIKKVLDNFQGDYDILYWNKAKVYTEIEEEWHRKKGTNNKTANKDVITSDTNALPAKPNLLTSKQ